MRADPRIIAAAILFVASPLRGDGLVWCIGPGGNRVNDAGPVVVPGGAVAMAAARATGLAQGFRLVDELPGNWHSLALVHDSTLTWPAHTTIFGTFETDSAGWKDVPCLDLFAMTPPYEQRVIRLGGDWPVTLPVTGADVWRQRFRKGPMATVLFVRFPVDSRGDIKAIRVVNDEGR